MNFNYNYDMNCYELGQQKENGRYMYNPILDTYVEDVDPLVKQNYITKNFSAEEFRAYRTCLLELVERNFWTDFFKIVDGGDCIYDWTFQLSIGKQKIRYAPYAMFITHTKVEEFEDYVKSLENWAE